MEIALVLGLLVLAIVLFATEKVSVDVITLLLLSALVLTGVLDVAGRVVFKLAGGSSRRLLVLLMGASSGLSAFMNNTTVTAMLLPAVGGVARRARISASKLLIPLGCGR